MSAPVLVRVTRYRCPHCPTSRAKKAAAQAHVDRCWHNPAARSCKTCVHYEPADPDGPYPEHPGWPEGCAQECDLTAGLRVHCPSWQPAPLTRPDPGRWFRPPPAWRNTMTDPTVTDLRRELEKARDALAAAEQHLARHAEMNAALHCAERVMYSPLHAKVATAMHGVDHALARTEPDPEDDAAIEGSRRRDAGLLAVLADLDRCEHGRHEDDQCNGCAGPSEGNPLLPPGAVIGHGLRGGQIVMPHRAQKDDPAAWRAQPEATS